MQATIKIPEQLTLSRDELLKMIRDRLPQAREVRYLSNIEPAAAGEKSLAIVYDGKLETDIKELLKKFIKKDEPIMTSNAQSQDNAIPPVMEQQPAPPMEPQPVKQSVIKLDEATSMAVPDLGSWVKNVLGVIEKIWNKVAALVKKLDDLKTDIEKDSTEFEREQEEKRLNAATALDERLKTISASIATINTSLATINTRLSAQDTNIATIKDDLALLQPEISSAKAYQKSMKEAMAKAVTDAEAKGEAAKKAKMAEMEAAKAKKA